MTTSNDQLDELLALFDGTDATRRYADGVNQRDHALQCAALAERGGADVALVAAALLHDVGHLLTAGQRRADGSVGEDLRHEDVGARYLRRSFGPDVTGPVALHVDAKRYLCAVDDDYIVILSPGSVRSLELQGGPMSATEAGGFEVRPGWQAAADLRRWDDGAKVAGLGCPPLEHYVPLLEALLGNESMRSGANSNRK